MKSVDRPRREGCIADKKKESAVGNNDAIMHQQQLADAAHEVGRAYCGVIGNDDSIAGARVLETAPSGYHRLAWRLLNSAGDPRSQSVRIRKAISPRGANTLV
jgi:hypothetical protein